VLTAFEACISRGGVALFPADTVYGLACDPENGAAVERLYALKGRAPDKPAAVMFFSMDLLHAATPWLGPRTRAALDALLPGGVTLLVPNPEHRFPLACGPDPDTLGLRVPAGSPLRGARVAVLQTSANHSGEPDPRRIEDVPPDIVKGARLKLGAGELPGVPSTVVDLRRYEDPGEWSVLREGAVSAAELQKALG
jgi:L-threonylcarbamoyladenylate synthase